MTSHIHEFDRSAFTSLLRRRLFFTESFEIYRKAKGFNGDSSGLYDYGPPGCGLQANIIDVWRKHFVLEEEMLEVDCTVLTPDDVLKTSGHVDKFADWMCKDPVNGHHLRADHLVESVLKARLAAEALDEATENEYERILAQIDNYDGPELGKLIKRFDIRNPDGNNEVLPPVLFNLMFKTSIGPSSAAHGFLRPETAQGQFLNFRKLLEYNQGTMPFASASIGKSYRNEISPRSGLLRVREFLMAEIEHYVDPQSGKQHPKFDEVRSVQLPLLDCATQLAGKTDIKKIPIGEAVRDKVVDNETLGYFLARIYAFLIKIGVDPRRTRFRQHLPNEMAHYATDCWDAELHTSYGWIECVGCADRSAYDLSVHTQRTDEKLVVQERHSEPLEITEWQASLDKKLVGRTFKRDAKLIETAIASLNQETLASLSQSLEDTGGIKLQVENLSDGQLSAQLSRDMVTISLVTRVENVREYTPNVIEPSFGIGRILYSLLEHVYWHRPEDAARGVLSLPVSVAPTKVLLVPLSNNAAFTPSIRRISQRLRASGIFSRVDSSGASIGKRYSRNDELGTPLGITVDFVTVKDGSVTLRERDSTVQVRGPENEVVAAVVQLVHGGATWQEATAKLPQFSAQYDNAR